METKVEELNDKLEKQEALPKLDDIQELNMEMETLKSTIEEQEE